MYTPPTVNAYHPRFNHWDGLIIKFGSIWIYFKLIFLAKQNLGLQTHRRGFSVEGLANQILESGTVDQINFRILSIDTCLPCVVQMFTEVGILNPQLGGVLIYYSEL